MAKKPAQVFHFDLYGKREDKYNFLIENSIASIQWQELEPQEPELFFVPKDFETKKEYDKGFAVNEIFPLNNVGIVTSRDSFVIDDGKQDLKERIKDFFDLSKEELQVKYKLKENKSWKINEVKNKAKSFDAKHIKTVSYRPFDNRWLYYDNNFIERSRADVMQHFIKSNNIGFTGIRINKENDDIGYTGVFITKYIAEARLSDRFITNIFPLYLYPESPQLELEETAERVPNLNMEIVDKIAKALQLDFVPEKFPSAGGVAEGRGGSTETAQRDSASGRGGSFETAQRVDTPGRGGSTEAAQRDSTAQRGGSQPATEHIPRSTRNYMDLPYNPALKERAHALRKAGNLSEVLFWNRVKKRQFKGLDFDRQKIIGNYIVDFYCASCNVVVEIDGSSHDNKQEYDARRDDFLESLGLTVIHIPVEDVMTRLDKVMVELGEIVPPRQAEDRPPCQPEADTPLPPRQHSADAPQPPRQPVAGTPPKEGNEPPRLSGTPPKEGNEEGNIAPIDILDYIYAVLHSPTYREKYKEFLKIDFPRVPYPKDRDTFWTLVELGSQIRQIHLLESSVVEEYITTYPKAGSNEVTRKLTLRSPGFVATEDGLGQVWINDEQYFDNVPLTAWELYIGGYQPAQKWLKDRVGRTLDFEDILHYQKVIVALSETERLMKEVDKVCFEN